MNVVPVFNENDAVLSKRSPSPVRPLATFAPLAGSWYQTQCCAGDILL